MNKESKIYLITIIIQFLLLIVQISIWNTCLINIDIKSYRCGMIMASITFLICLTKNIVKKIVRWLNE